MCVGEGGGGREGEGGELISKSTKLKSLKASSKGKQ